MASAGNASQEETFLVSSDGKKIIRGGVYDIAKNPFDAEKARDQGRLNSRASDPDSTECMRGYYSDFQCSFCKEEAKADSPIPGAGLS